MVYTHTHTIYVHCTITDKACSALQNSNSTDYFLVCFIPNKLLSALSLSSSFHICFLKYSNHLISFQAFHWLCLVYLNTISCVSQTSFVWTEGWLTTSRLQKNGTRCCTSKNFITSLGFQRFECHQKTRPQEEGCTHNCIVFSQWLNGNRSNKGISWYTA